MVNKHNMDKVCRTCLSERKFMETIFEVKVSEEHNVQIIDFIRCMTSIKISKCDRLPDHICVHCINDLCRIYEFAQMCINNDLKLKEALEKNETLQVNENISEGLKEKSLVDELNSLSNKLNEASNYKEIIIIKKSDDFNIECNKHGYVLDENNDQLEYSISAPSITEEPKEKSNQRLNNFFECNICSKSYSKETLLNVHLQSHNKSQENFVCNICDQKFNYLYLLKKHSYKHQDAKPFPCTICQKGCITAESLRRHMKTHDKDYVKKKHICNVCSKEFPYPSFLAEHMKNHTGERPFLCSICGKGYRQSGTLQYHMRSHTGNRPYICNICNNSFTCPGILRVHMRRHTNERPYVCDICGMAFRQSTDMKCHRRTHTGDKPALCTICGKRFSSSSQLNIHIRSHTGEKPFLCSSCSKSFTTKAMLVKHERIHTGERPYVCKICCKAFSQSGTLKTHLNTHKSLKPPINKNVVKQSVTESDGQVNIIVLPTTHSLLPSIN